MLTKAIGCLLAAFFQSNAFAEDNLLTLPSGENFTCIDKNVYTVVEKKISLYRERNPNCSVKFWATTGEGGRVLLEIGERTYSCSPQLVNIAAQAGCTF